jgi:hypothetical protein
MCNIKNIFKVAGALVFYLAFIFLALSGGVFWWLPKVLPLEPGFFFGTAAAASLVIAVLIVTEKI